MVLFAREALAGSRRVGLQFRSLQFGVEVIRGALREASGCEAAAWPRQSHDTLIRRPMLNRDLRRQELASRSLCANLLVGDRWSVSTVPTLNSVGAGQRLLFPLDRRPHDV